MFSLYNFQSVSALWRVRVSEHIFMFSRHHMLQLHKNLKINLKRGGVILSSDEDDYDDYNHHYDNDGEDDKNSIHRYSEGSSEDETDDELSEVSSPHSKASDEDTTATRSSTRKESDTVLNPSQQKKETNLNQDTTSDVVDGSDKSLLPKMSFPVVEIMQFDAIFSDAAGKLGIVFNPQDMFSLKVMACDESGQVYNVD